VNQGTRTLQAAADRLEAEQLTNMFAYHFSDLGNLQAKSTFAAIQQSLMTEIELNPNALARVQELYNHVIDKLDYSDFMDDPNSTDPNQEYWARQQHGVLIGKYGGPTDRYGRSSLMSSFLALAMTSDKFRDILSRMEKPKTEQNASGTLDAVLENRANQMMDSLSARLAGEGKTANVKDALDLLMQSMIENVGDQRSFISRETESFLDRVDSKVSRVVQDKVRKGCGESRGYFPQLEQPCGQGRRLCRQPGCDDD
jgi:hypothetical protein